MIDDIFSQFFKRISDYDEPESHMRHQVRTHLNAIDKAISDGDVETMRAEMDKVDAILRPKFLSVTIESPVVGGYVTITTDGRPGSYHPREIARMKGMRKEDIRRVHMLKGTFPMEVEEVEWTTRR